MLRPHKGSGVLTFCESGLAIAGAEEKPEESGDEIGEINIGELAVRAFGDGIKISGQGEKHGGTREPGNDLCAGAVGVVGTQIAREGDADESVSDDEAVGSERSHPAIHVQAAGATRGEDGNRENRGRASDSDGDAGGCVASMSFPQRGVRKAVVRHQKKNAGGGGDACERACEHADERTDVDEQAEEGKAANFGENAHGSLAGAQILAGQAEAEHFGVGADNEDGSSEKGALDYGAGNCF